MTEICVCEAGTTIYEFQKNTKSSDSTFHSCTVPDKKLKRVPHSLY